MHTTASVTYGTKFWSTAYFQGHAIGYPCSLTNNVVGKNSGRFPRLKKRDQEMSSRLCYAWCCEIRLHEHVSRDHVHNKKKTGAKENICPMQLPTQSKPDVRSKAKTVGENNQPLRIRTNSRFASWCNHHQLEWNRHISHVKREWKIQEKRNAGYMEQIR